MARLLNRFYCNLCNGSEIQEVEDGYVDDNGEAIEVLLFKQRVCHKECVENYQDRMTCEHDFKIYEEYHKLDRLNASGELLPAIKATKTRCTKCNTESGEGDLFRIRDSLL